jgi:hypothetical protein
MVSRSTGTGEAVIFTVTVAVRCFERIVIQIGVVAIALSL